MGKSTKQQILYKTAELLERQGYHATGLNQIVQESDTPRGSLYYYFPQGKEELAAAAVTERAQRMNAAILDHLSKIDHPAEAIYAFALDLADHVASSSCSEGAPFATVTLEAPATSEKLRAACFGAYELLRLPFAQKLRSHGYASDQAQRLSTTITAALEGAIILSRAQKSAEPIRQVAEDIKFLVNQTAVSNP